MPAYSVPISLTHGRPRPVLRNNFVHHRSVRRIFSDESEIEPVIDDVSEAEDAVFDSDVNMDSDHEASVDPVRRKMKVLKIDDRKRKAEYQDGPSKRIREDPELAEDRAVEEALDPRPIAPVPRRIRANPRLAAERAAQEVARGLAQPYVPLKDWASIILAYKQTAIKTRTPGHYTQGLIHTLRQMDFSPVQRAQRKKGTTRCPPKTQPQPDIAYGMTARQAIIKFRAARTARILVVREYNARPEVFEAVQDMLIRTEWFPAGRQEPAPIPEPVPAPLFIFQGRPAGTLVVNTQRRSRMARVQITSVPRKPAPKPRKQRTIAEILAISRRLARDEQRDRMYREMIDRHLDAATPVRHVSNLHCNFEEGQVEHLLPAAEIVSPIRRGRRDSTVSILSEPPSYPATPQRVPTPRAARQPYLPNYRPPLALPSFDDKTYESISWDVMSEEATAAWRIVQAELAAEAAIKAAARAAIEDIELDELEAQANGYSLPVQPVQPVQPVHHAPPINQAPVAAVHNAANNHNDHLYNNNNNNNIHHHGPVDHHNIHNLAQAQINVYQNNNNNNNGFGAAREVEEGPDEVALVERAFEQVNFNAPVQFQQPFQPVQQDQELQQGQAQAQGTGIIGNILGVVRSFLW